MIRYVIQLMGQNMEVEEKSREKEYGELGSSVVKARWSRFGSYLDTPNSKDTMKQKSANVKEQEIPVGLLRGTHAYLLMQVMEITRIKQIKHQIGNRKKVKTIQGE